MHLNTALSVLCSVLVLKAKAEITNKEYASMPQVFQLDSYDHCMLLEERALYCNVQFQLAPARTNYSTVWKTIQETNLNRKNYRHDWLRYGVCVPQSCPQLAGNISTYKGDHELLKSELAKCYSEKFANIRLEASVMEMNCLTNVPRYLPDGYDIFVAFVLAILVAVVILSSFYEGLARYKSKEEYDTFLNTTSGKIASSFSIIKNWKSLLERPKNTDADIQSLQCFNGFRTFTILSVLACHSCIVKVAASVSNSWFTEQLTDGLVQMTVLNGQYVMQTFLVMSGWLLSSGFFSLFKKHKRVRLDFVGMAIIERWIRIIIPYMVVVAISATITYHLGDGPLWDKIVGMDYRNCRENWWRNFLFINNYFDPNDMCLIHSWYLSTDTQLFVLSLIVLTIMWMCKSFILHIIGVTMIIGMLIPAISAYTRGYEVVLQNYAEPLYKLLCDTMEFRENYISAQNNITGYIVGFIGGYIYIKYKEKEIKLEKYQVAMWWCLVFVPTCAVVYSGYLFYRDSFVHTKLGAAIYLALAKPVFALGIALFMLGVSRRIGWFVRDLLTWWPIVIIGRLTYSIYLVHFPIMRIRTGLARHPYHLSPYEILRDYFSDLVMSIIAAVMLTLFVEMPTRSLLKLAAPRKSKSRKDPPADEPISIISKIGHINGQDQISKI